MNLLATSIYVDQAIYCRRRALINGKGELSYSASGSLRQLDHQRTFLPQHKDKLLGPLLALFAKLHVEMPEHSREDAAHFRVRQTSTNCISSSTVVIW